MHCVVIYNTLFSALSTPNQCFGLVRTHHVPTHVPNAQHEPIPYPGPQAIYYGARTPILDVNADLELDATSNPTYVPVPAAMIDTDFVLRPNYWLSNLNIKRACYNVLNETIDDAFKFPPDPNLTGWNPSMEIIDIMEQMTTAYGRPTSTALSKMKRYFTALTRPSMHPRFSSVGLRIVKKS